MAVFAPAARQPTSRQRRHGRKNDEGYSSGTPQNGHTVRRMIAVKFRARYLLAAVAGMGIALPAWAQEPARLGLERAPAPGAGAHDNQEVADRIAQQLQQSANLRQYNIDISVKGGTVELIGNVGDAKQREQAQKIAMSAPGVTNVVDKLTTGNIQRVSTTQEPANLPPVPAPAPLQMPQLHQQIPIAGPTPVPAQIQIHAGVPQTVFGEPQA